MTIARETVAVFQTKQMTKGSSFFSGKEMILQNPQHFLHLIVNCSATFSKDTLCLIPDLHQVPFILYPEVPAIASFFFGKFGLASLF